jgi:hypothetical protein
MSGCFGALGHGTGGKTAVARTMPDPASNPTTGAELGQGDKQPEQRKTTQETIHEV